MEILTLYILQNNCDWIELKKKKIKEWSILKSQKIDIFLIKDQWNKSKFSSCEQEYKCGLLNKKK